MAARPVLYSMPISHYCISADRMLAFKGVPFDTRYVPYHDKTELIKATGQDYVPTLMWEGKPVMWYDIPDFLERQKPSPTFYPWNNKGLPVTVEEWGHQVLEERVWRYVVTKIPPVLRSDHERWVFEEMQTRARGPWHVLEMRRAEFREDMNKHLGMVDQMLAGRDWLLGEPSLAASGVRGSEGGQDLDRLLPRAIPDRDDVRVEGPLRLDCAFRLRGHDEAVQAEGEPGLRDGLAAEDLREPVRASPADLLLRPEVRRIDLEDHPGVVVEPADDAHVERVVRPSDAVVVEESREVPQVGQPLLRGGAEDLRGVVEDGGVAGELDQLPKGRGEVLAAQPAQLRLEHREVPLVQGMEDDALVRRRKGQVRTQDADIPDPRLDLFEPDRPHRPDREGERLRVRGQRRAADDLRVQLRELAVPAPLRLLVPERVPGRVQLEGLRPAPEAGDVEPQDGGREFGPQGQIASALVLERVQLLW